MRGKRKVAAVLSFAAALGIAMLGQVCWGDTTSENKFFNQYKLLEADGIGAYRECSVIQGNVILAKTVSGDT